MDVTFNRIHNEAIIIISDDKVSAHFSMENSDEYGFLFSFDEFTVDKKSVYKYDWCVCISDIKAVYISEIIKNSTLYADTNKISEISFVLEDYMNNLKANNIKKNKIK